jgi:hypothetical protein
MTMRKRNMLIVVGALAVTALAAVGVRAATSYTAPTTLGYSGTLLSGSSPAADGNYVLTFTLFGAATGGTALWTETQTSVPVTAGRFSVVLGATTAIPRTALDSTTPWLEIRVGSEVLSPRQQVTSVPYALRVPLQCRTVEVSQSVSQCNVTVTASCDADEFVVSGLCPGWGSTAASVLSGVASYGGDTGFNCVYIVPSGGSGCVTSSSLFAQARCCKM